MTKRIPSLGLDRFSGLYLGAIFIVVFGILSPTEFLTPGTMHLVASSQAVAAILAIAVLIPMVCGQFDLSVGAVANLSGMVAVVAQVSWNWPVLPAILLAVAVGIAIGALNGAIVVKLRVSSFITTLGMSSILIALQTIITNSQQPNAPASTLWNGITQTPLFGFQIVILYLVILAIVTWWVLDFTPIGRYMYAAGGNPEAARLSGVQVDRWSWLSLVASAGISGLGGVLYVSLTGPALTFGPSLLLPAFSAVFLGSTQLQPGRFNVWGTVLAIFVLAIGVEGLQLVSGVQWISDMFNGVALIAAVALAVTRQRSSFKGFRTTRGKADASNATGAGSDSGSPHAEEAVATRPGPG